MPAAIAIAAHPDDIEFLMAGTLIKLRDAGYDIHYFNVSDGSLGGTEHDAATTAAIRADEGRAAAGKLGATFHASICSDLAVFYDGPTLAKVASVIRQAKPEIVLTHSPVDYMEDHQNVCRLAVTGAFARGMPNFVASPPAPTFDHDVAVYHAQPYSHRDPLKRFVKPEFLVDTTSVIEQKTAALAEHASQQQWLDESQQLNCYLQTLRDLDAEMGELSGQYQYAEGWRSHLHLGFGAADFNPLAEVLADSVTVVQ